MEIIPQEVLYHKGMLKLVNVLVENWMYDHEVPSKYRMSVPLVLLFEKSEENGNAQISFRVSPLLNHTQGNC